MSKKKFCHRCLVEEAPTTSERDDVYECSGGGVTRDLCYECMESWRRGDFPLYLVEAPPPEGCVDAPLTVDLGQMLVAPDGTPICSAADCPRTVVRWEVEGVLGFCRRHSLLDTV